MLFPCTAALTSEKASSAPREHAACSRDINEFHDGRLELLPAEHGAGLWMGAVKGLKRRDIGGVAANDATD